MQKKRALPLLFVVLLLVSATPALAKEQMPHE